MRSSRLSLSTGLGRRPISGSRTPRLARPLKSPRIRIRNGVSGSGTAWSGCVPVSTSRLTDALEKRSDIGFDQPSSYRFLDRPRQAGAGQPDERLRGGDARLTAAEVLHYFVVLAVDAFAVLALVRE